MEMVGVDILGRFHESDRGNKYVLCAMDCFTKWPEAYALPDQEAETVGDTLMEDMYRVYRVQIPPSGRKVVLHWNRLAPNRWQAVPLFEGVSTAGTDMGLPADFNP